MISLTMLIVAIVAALAVGSVVTFAAILYAAAKFPIPIQAPESARPISKEAIPERGTDPFHQTLLEATDIVEEAWKFGVQQAHERGGRGEELARVGWIVVRDALNSKMSEEHLIALDSGFTTGFISFDPAPVEGFDAKLAAAVAAEMDLRDAHAEDAVRGT